MEIPGHFAGDRVVVLRNSGNFMKIPGNSGDFYENFKKFLEILGSRPGPAAGQNKAFLSAVPKFDDFPIKFLKILEKISEFVKTRVGIS